MLYDEARMALTKERLEDLRKEKKLSFEQLSKQLAERGVNISHTNLKNYEINDPVHPLYGRTRSMSIEYLTAFADFYDVSVEYLLGLSNSRKKEYHDISEQLGLCDKAIDELIQCKENSSSEEGQQLYVSQDTAILNDFLISAEFRRVMEKIKKSLLHITCTSCPRTASLHKYGKKAFKRWKKLRKFWMRAVIVQWSMI